MLLAQLIFLSSELSLTCDHTNCWILPSRDSHWDLCLLKRKVSPLRENRKPGVWRTPGFRQRCNRRGTDYVLSLCCVYYTSKSWDGVVGIFPGILLSLLMAFSSDFVVGSKLKERSGVGGEENLVLEGILIVFKTLPRRQHKALLWSETVTVWSYVWQVMWSWRVGLSAFSLRVSKYY